MTLEMALDYLAAAKRYAIYLDGRSALVNETVTNRTPPLGPDEFLQTLYADRLPPAIFDFLDPAIHGHARRWPDIEAIYSQRRRSG